MRRADGARCAAIAAALLAFALPAAAQGGSSVRDEGTQEKRAEAEAVPPEFPKPGNLVEFYVSAGATNHFFVDATTLNPGTDGVVRYVLVVKTPGGATNVSFEGIRCSSGEYRIFSVGTGDGKWLKARDDWRPIREERVNRYRAALASDYFCPDGIAIRSADEGRRALRRGGAGKSYSP